MSNIPIDQLAGEVTKAVQEYTEYVSEGIALTVDEIANEVLMETAMRAPHRTGQYARGFIKTNKSLGSHSNRRYVIWNKKHYRLVHLLEFGHAKRGGGRVPAQPHMIPVYDKWAPELENRIKRVIKNGG